MASKKPRRSTEDASRIATDERFRPLPAESVAQDPLSPKSALIHSSSVRFKNQQKRCCPKRNLFRSQWVGSRRISGSAASNLEPRLAEDQSPLVKKILSGEWLLQGSFISEGLWASNALDKREQF
jgi:hypothetical protein